MTTNNAEYVFTLWRRLEHMRQVAGMIQRLADSSDLTDYVQVKLPSIVDAQSSKTIPTRYTELLLEYDSALRNLGVVERMQFENLKRLKKMR